MKKCILFLLSLATFGGVMAQSVNYDVKTTEIITEKIRERTYGIQKIGYDGEDVYFLHKPYKAVFGEASLGSTEGFYISKLDSDLRLLKKSMIDLKEGKNQMQFEGVHLVNNKLTCFASFQNVKQKKHYLFIRKLDHETLQPEGDLKPIGELDYSGFSRYNNTIFQYEISDDSSKVLVFYTFVSRKNEVLKFGMYIFDNEFNELWKNENVSPRHVGGVFSYEMFKIDNQGNVYLLGKHYTDKGNYFDEASFRKRGFTSSETYFADVPNYTYQLYVYMNRGIGEAYTDITLPGKFIRSLNFTPESPDKVICFGIWSAPSTISAKGGFMFSLDAANRQAGDLLEFELDATMIEQGFSEKELNRFKRSMKNKDEWDPFNYLISDLKTFENGDRYFIAEQFLQGEKEEYQGKTTVIKPLFMHNDLYVFRIKSDNTPGRIDRISKRQYFLVTSRFNSYHVEEMGGNLFFLFNSIPRRDNYTRRAILGETYLVTLNQQGAQDKVALQRGLTLKVQGMMPATAISTEPGSIFYSLMSFLYRNHAFGKITLQ